MKRWLTVWLAGLGVMLAGGAMAAPEVKVSDLLVDGRVKGEDFSFRLTLTATGNRVGARIPLVRGAVVLSSVPEAKDWRLHYDSKGEAYTLEVLAGATPVPVDVEFTARADVEPKNAHWRRVSFEVPSSGIRRVRVTAEGKDLELKLPGALQQLEDRADTTLTVSGILRPDVPFVARWQAQVETVEAKLLLASEANTILTVSPGALRADSLFVYEINQGALQELRFAVPAELSVTQVRGEFLQDWHTESGEQGSTLIVKLNREQRQQYRLQVLGEMALPQLPTEIDAPVIRPLDGTRADGFMMIGTNSAIQLQVQQSTGLAQVDATAFPRVPLQPKQARQMPQDKAFYYSFAATPYQLHVALADIVPSFDADERLLITARDDDLTLDAEVEIDVRDAPVRHLEFQLPAAFVVASVTGPQVVDYAVVEPTEADGVRRLTVDFKEPVIGKSLVQFRLELGRSPLGATHEVVGLTIPQARNERGFVVITADRGVMLDTPITAGLRQVHTRAIPMRVADAQFAWRFREPGWRLQLPVKERPAAIRAEAFHLLSLGDGIAYGSVAVTYFISGAPVDELRFRVPEQFQDVEFVGLDVNRWTHEGEEWRVKLRRKVIGDYNLGVTFSQRYDAEHSVLTGGIVCEGVETQTGFITVASHRNLKLAEKTSDEALIPISHEETPGQYRLLVSAPTLRSYKYVSAPHRLELAITPYDRGTTPAVMVEFINAHTNFSLDEKGRAESVTRVRYTVKNSSAQFLDLKVPEGLDMWETRLIDKDANGNEKKQRLIPSRHGDTLKIPLRRQRNPNEPLTVEVEYGQVHGRLGWRGLLGLQLPPSLVPATYADWQLTTPSGWTLQPAGGGSMGSSDKMPRRLLLLGRTVLRGWLRALTTPGMFVGSISVLVLFGLSLVLRRRWVSIPLAVALALLLLWLGLAAWHFAGRSWSTPAPCRSVAFSQVLDLDAQTPLTVQAYVVPDWREHFGLGRSLLLVLLATGALWQAARTRQRRYWLALLATLGLVFVIQFNAGLMLGMNVLTWGLPVLVVLLALGAAVRHTRAQRLPGLEVAAVLMLWLGLPGMAEAKSVPSPPPAVVADSLTCSLTAAEDSVNARLELTVSSEDGVVMPLASAEALLLAAPANPDVRVVREGDQLSVEIPAGRHQFSVELLFPLPEKTPDQSTTFTMPLPPALTNQVSLVLPDTELAVTAPDAIQLDTSEQGGKTQVSMVLKPYRPLTVSWQPRGRRTRLEKTAFFAELTSLARVGSGLVEAWHQVRFRIAQGELMRIELGIPAEMTVTRVKGEKVGSWRFDPVGHRLQVGLEQPMTGDYTLDISTQIAADTMPYTARVGVLEIQGATRQRGILGLAATGRVTATVKTHPQPMNVADFKRSAAALLTDVPGGGEMEILHAYRLADPKAEVTMTVDPVSPELRATEKASFDVSDERLVYNGVFDVDIAKAGRFYVDLGLPDGYDVDELTATGLSHWDEVDVDGERRARLHFQKQWLGKTRISLALSQAVNELPDTIPVPRVSVAEALKHRGELVVSAERGVRLAVAERDGVSELDVAQLNLRDKPALAFRLLRPNWRLVLQSEVLTPSITVKFLHVAEVSDGLVRHTHYLRYTLQHAGARAFEIQVPVGALGLLISGPEIARKELVDPATGRWRVELTSKWFDRPFPLQVKYETRFDPAVGSVPIEPLLALDADRQTGDIAVRTTARVELAGATASEGLQRAEARNISTDFGAGDLADAAFCYSSTTPDYELSFRAARHDAAALLEAEVEQANLTTVVSRRHDSIHQVQLTMRAGGKRHLHVRLPHGATIWSLLVDRQSRTPTFAGSDADPVLLIPLPQSTDGDLSVAVDLIYIEPRQADRGFDYHGPLFDLPLRNITWNLYVPEGYFYYNFDGTLTVDEGLAEQARIQVYDINTYETENKRLNDADLKKAVALQQRGLALAKQGNQKGARQALSQAFNYSVSDKSLNEDARVNFRNLLRQQAVVGLVGRRNDVRQEDVAQQQAPAAQALGDRFTQEEAERLQSSLSKSDSENLERITNRIIEIQEAAAGVAMQLMVKPPLHGRQLTFRRPLQVEPNSDMHVSFSAWRKPTWTWGGGLACALALFLLVLGLLAVAPVTPAVWRRFERRPVEEVATSVEDFDFDDEFAAEIDAEDTEVEETEPGSPADEKLTPPADEAAGGDDEAQTGAVAEQDDGDEAETDEKH